MIALLLAAAAVAPQPVAQPAQVRTENLTEAGRAIAAGRRDQARAMIAAAVGAGASGEQVDRLVADLAFADGDHAVAYAGYVRLLAAKPGDALLAERAGIAALRWGRSDYAEILLRRAAEADPRSWRTWNALGVLADRRQDWGAADEAYWRAIELSPEQAEVANNFGWSLLLRGRWNEAVEPLEKAAGLDPRSERIAANLEFARAAIGEGLPQRRDGESGEDWAARLNDAGVAAAAQGDRARAIAAFSQAIEARSRWFARAANNLARLEAAR